MQSKSYLHNDLNADNVVPGQISVCEELNPVVIDFGKSVRESSSQAYRKRQPHGMQHETIFGPRG